jgi:hypothetical protein
LPALSNQAGKWYEGVTEDNAAKVGIIGLKSLKGVDMGDKRIAVPETAASWISSATIPAGDWNVLKLPPSPCAIGQ